MMDLMQLLFQVGDTVVCDDMVRVRMRPSYYFKRFFSLFCPMLARKPGMALGVLVPSSLWMATSCWKGIIPSRCK